MSSLYSRTIFPALYDLVMDQEFLARHRREQLADVEGEILEIGLGTGLNLPHYPQHVRRITTVEPNPGMNRKARRRAERCGIEVDQRQIGGECLPLDDASFDCVVSTLVMCSIRELQRALGEVRRVLKPGGRLLFFEHGVSLDESVRRWQRRLNPLQGLIGDGCRLDLDVPAVLATQPFATIEHTAFYLEQGPRTHTYIYRGVAVK